MKDRLGSDERDVIRRYFAALHVGAAAPDDLVGLFANDATYVEPFSRGSATHVWKARHSSDVGGVAAVIAGGYTADTRIG